MPIIRPTGSSPTPPHNPSSPEPKGITTLPQRIAKWFREAKNRLFPTNPKSVDILSKKKIENETTKPKEDSKQLNKNQKKASSDITLLSKQENSLLSEKSKVEAEIAETKEKLEQLNKTRPEVPSDYGKSLSGSDATMDIQMGKEKAYRKTTEEFYNKQTPLTKQIAAKESKLKNIETDLQKTSEKKAITEFQSKSIEKLKEDKAALEAKLTEIDKYLKSLWPGFGGGFDMEVKRMKCTQSENHYRPIIASYKSEIEKIEDRIKKLEKH